MALEDTHELKPMLAVFAPEVQDTAWWIREFIWERFPTSNELIYDNYNALAIGWGLTDRLADVFVSFAVYGGGVNLGFNRGNELSDPQGLLKGGGSYYRHYRLGRQADFPSAYMEGLMHDAWMNAQSRLKPTAKPAEGLTMVKSVSEKKKRPSG
jgi:hypothetical protein